MDDVTASIIIACQTAGAVTSINKLDFALGMLAKHAAEFSWQFATDSLAAFNMAQDASWKFGKTFRNSMGTATQAVREFMSEYNLSEQTAKTMLTDTAGVLKGFGFDEKEALKMSESVSRMGVDLASFTGHAGGAKDAVQAITAAMLGETERMKGYGTVIRMDDKELRELTKTIVKNRGVTEDQARAIAILETIIKKNKDAIGDYKAEGENWTQAMNNQREAIIQLKSSLGELVYETFNLYSSTENLTSKTKEITSYIDKTGKTWAYAISSVLIRIREGLSMVGAFFKPLGAALMTTGEMIVNTGDWVFNNWGQIWSNMSDVAIAAGKDILHSWLFIPKLIIKAWTEGFKNIGRLLYKQLQNIRDVRTGKISFNESIKRSLKDDFDMFSGQIDYVINEGIKQYSAIGDNTKRALARVGTSPFPWPEFDPSVYLAYTDWDRLFNGIKRKYDAQRSELRESFLKSLPQAEIKSARNNGNNGNNGNNDDNGNPGNEFSSSLKKIADDIFRYRETTQSAILANSLEGARLQSRMMIQNSGVNLSNNPQKITAEQSKKQTTLLEEVRNLLDDFVNNTTPISTRPVR